MYKQIKALKNQNKMLFKMDNNYISHRDMNKINKIKREIYDYSNSYGSSVSSDSESI